MKTRTITRWPLAALIALCLALPGAFYLHLKAISSVNPPPLVVISDDFGIGRARVQQGIIKDVLTISGTTYNSTIITESAVYAVQTSGNVLVNSGADVCFEATKQVHLTSGFHAAAGSKFQARIGLSVYALDRPTESDGAPVGLLAQVDSNNNGIPDLIEYTLGLDPRADNSNDPRIQSLQAQAQPQRPQQQQPYEYDKNSQLTGSPERTYQLDAEGNITGKQQP